MNTLMVIRPYKFAGVWVFDDAQAGLVKEPFVGNVNRILDELTAGLPQAERGFTLLFSAQPFPGFQAAFERRREEFGGWWYFSPAHNLEGWLCPAMFHYFKSAPEWLYVQALLSRE
jgi:hypothetical protein